MVVDMSQYEEMSEEDTVQFIKDIGELSANSRFVRID